MVVVAQWLRVVEVQLEVEALEGPREEGATICCSCSLFRCASRCAPLFSFPLFRGPFAPSERHPQHLTVMMTMVRMQPSGATLKVVQALSEHLRSEMCC